MDLSKESSVRGRYRREDGKVVIEIALGEARQIFNAKDPAPFRERDLDDDFVTYIASSAQEFPLSTPMKIQIHVSKENFDSTKVELIRDAIHGYFSYEARLAQAQILGSLNSDERVLSIIQEGLVIVGWVAIWRPSEVILYEWWPLKEESRYYEKLAQMEVEIRAK